MSRKILRIRIILIDKWENLCYDDDNKIRHYARIQEETPMLRQVTDTILYVGANDHDVDLFEGQYVVPNGMAYNS